jgi:hypothetical protein
VFILFLLSLNFLQSQVLTTSPLSYFGMGQKSIETNPIFQALGNSTVAFLDSGVINLNNPASYADLGSGYTLLSTGIHANFSRFTEKGNNSLTAFSNINHLAIGMRVHPRIGLAFGFKPYSYRGYNFTDKIFTGSDSIRYDYKGIGSTQIAFLGMSFKLLNFKTTTLSVGVNMGYLFGNLSNDRLSRLITSNSLQGGVEKTQLTISSLYYQIGALYQQNLSKNSKVNIGFSIEPKQLFNSTYSSGLFYSSNVFNEKFYDTLSYYSANGSIQMPSLTQIGFEYTLKFKNLVKNNRKLNSEFKILGNLSNANYSNYSETFDTLTTSANLASNQRLGIGIQWIPERNYYENNSLTKFYERIYYRAGFFQEKATYLDSERENNHFGITFGIGLPIFAQQSLSSVNFGVTLGSNKTNVENSLNENYASVNFGVILSPSVFDKWFRKRKLD